MSLRSISLPWSPYYMLEDCGENGTEICKDWGKIKIIVLLTRTMAI